jgi:hypothetical protein
MSKDGNVALAFIIAPLATPIVFLLCDVVSERGRFPLDVDALLIALGPMLVLLLLAYAAEGSLGLLAWTIFRRLSIRSLPAFAIAGALIGWIMMVAVVSTGSKPITPLLNPLRDGVPCLLLAGSVSGVTFRFFIIRELRDPKPGTQI